MKFFTNLFKACVVICALALGAQAHAALTITPITWDVIGLDSNRPATGPRHFPVGARVCSASSTNDPVTVTFAWTTPNTYINIRPDTAAVLTFPALAAAGCVDAYFEVEVTGDPDAYGATRGYTITATDGTLSATTPTPRQLYIERLISQNRNSTLDIKVGTTKDNLTPVAPGGSMTLMVGSTYFIQLDAKTATQGYEQLETFITLTNTRFQILSVETTYSANTAPPARVSSPHDQLYADACWWDSNPSSSNYRSCLDSGKKSGGTISVLYEVRILGGAGTTQTLNSLVYDFSGASFHYNSDYSAGARFANIISATLEKSFNPKRILPGETSSLTFTIKNPGTSEISDVRFTDTLPSEVTIAATEITYTNCGTTPAPAPASLTVGDTALDFSSITVPGGESCTISVTVTSLINDTYPNTTDNLFIGDTDTESQGTDTLLVSSLPPAPSSCAAGDRVTLAEWRMPETGQGSGTTTPPAPSLLRSGVSETTTIADSSLTGVGGAQSISTTAGNPVNSWRIEDAWSQNGATVPGAGTSPYYSFTVDSSEYGGVAISVDLLLGDGGNENGDWAANNNNYIFIYSRADGGSFSTISQAETPQNKGNWNTGVTATAAASGTGTTAFRVQASTRGNKATSVLYIDNVIITGCPRPPDQATLSKAFTAQPSIPLDGTTALTFTFTNPNTVSLGSVGFTDTLPSGLVVATPNGLSTPPTCTTGTISDQTISAVPGERTISMSGVAETSGATLSTGASCSFSVDVTGAAAGQYTNVTSYIESAAGVNTTMDGYGQANLDVVAPPIINKFFGATNLLTNGTTTLGFSIVNPNTFTSLTGVAFTDTLPGGLVVASPNGLSGSCGGGTITANANSSSITLSGATLAPGASCTFLVSVTGNSVGEKVNEVEVSSTNGGTGNTAEARMEVRDPISSLAFLKQVGASANGPWFSYLPVAIGASVYYRFTVENTGDTDLTSVAVTDDILSSFTCTWQYIAVAVGPPPTETLTAYNPQSPLTIPAPDPDNEQHIAYCVPGSTVTAVSGEQINTATVSSTQTSNAESSATYNGVQPTAVVMGQVGLDYVNVADFLRGIGALDLDAAGLLALLRAWDPAAAAALEGASRAALLAALRDYLDPDGDGRVVLFRWETLEERGTIGFYAERREGSLWTPINADLLPGLIAAPMGAEYWLADPGAAPGETYQYRLIETEATGTTREYGPFDLRVGNATQ